MNAVASLSVRIVGHQVVDHDVLQQFLTDEGMVWEPSTENPADLLPEIAGRLCYMSFGTGRKENADYADNILGVGHGSVIEHTVFNFLITGVSRSLTHELVRHRAGFGYSQLSQRYVDESAVKWVLPAIIDDDAELREMVLAHFEVVRTLYQELTTRLAAKLDHLELSKTEKRKGARQAARCVLPNATETKIFVTANSRALRHFLALRGSSQAEPEIRVLAVNMCRLLKKASPHWFADIQEEILPDGTVGLVSTHPKV